MATVVLAIVVGVAVATVARSVKSAITARQSIAVHALGAVETAEWHLGDRATLVSAAGRTHIVARLTRTSTAAQTPALTGNFDGSGGGDATLITCTADSKKWSAPIYETQAIVLACDDYVTPFAVHQFQYVYVGAVDIPCS